MPKFNPTDIIQMASNSYEVAEKLNGFNDNARVQLKAGKTAKGTIDLVDTPTHVYAVIAFDATTGAVATKALLDETNDYTVAGKVLTCVTDQSANKLLILYTAE